MSSDERLRPSVAEVRDWLRERLTAETEGDVELDPQRPLADYDIDSIAIVGVSGDLEDWLDIEIDPTLFFDHPTLDQLAEFLANEASRGD